MATLKLKISDKVLDKVLTVLGQFNNEDLEIIESNNEFDSNKRHLETELKKLDSGKSKTYSIEEADEILESTIRKYEG